MAIPEEDMEIDSNSLESDLTSDSAHLPSSSMNSLTYLPKIDESNANANENTVIKRFIAVLDQLDTRVEKLRKESIALQDKRDMLLMSIDVLKNNEHFAELNEYEKDEINCYVQRVAARLATIELNVQTVRDVGQEDCLHQINSLIDSIIVGPDRLMARQRCQTFLNCCSCSDTSLYDVSRIVDKKFEISLLGCTLDDQKNIKKRLQALMTYLNKQTISD